MSNINDLIEQAKGMDDPAKIIEMSKGRGLDISEAEAKAFVDTQELPDSVMDAIAGGANKGGCPKCGAPLEEMYGVGDAPGGSWVYCSSDPSHYSRTYVAAL